MSTSLPTCSKLPFHKVVTTCPPGRTSSTVQPVIAIPLALTVTVPTNPPAHLLAS